MKNYFSSARSIIIFLISLILIGFGCSDTSTEPDNNTSWGEDVTNFDVEWEDNVVQFTDENLNDIISIDSVNQIFHINKSSSHANQLVAGNIIRVGDYALRKISRVDSNSPEIQVETEETTFIEAVKNADISWDYGVDFSQENIINTFKQNGYSIQVVTADSLGFSFSYGSYDVQGWTRFVGEKTLIQLEIVKSIGNVKPAKLIVDGEFQRFRSKGKIKIENKQLKEFESNANNQQAKFTVKVIAAGSGSDNNIEIPFTLVKGPLGIPFAFFEIKFLGILNAYVPDAGSTLMEEKFTYSADEGFKYVKEENDCKPIANLKKIDIKESEDQQHTGGPGVVQMAWGIAIPRFEITFMGSTLLWFHSAFLLDGYYRQNPACQMINANFYGAAGWGVGILGFSFASGSTNLFKNTKVIKKVGTCPD